MEVLVSDFYKYVAALVSLSHIYMHPFSMHGNDCFQTSADGL